jgi:two-component system NtrC family sensor kinase
LNALVPYAVTIFALPLAVAAFAVAILALERRRVRNDRLSAALGAGFGLAGVLALAQAVAPVPSALIDVVGFSTIAIALRESGRTPAPGVRARWSVPLGLIAGGSVIAAVAARLGPTLASTPLAVGLSRFVIGAAAVWAVVAAARRVRGAEREPLAPFLLVAALVWAAGVLARAIDPAVAGVARIIAAGGVFAGLVQPPREGAVAPQTAADDREAVRETQALMQADKLKALGTLLSGVAHELNNPLSTIQLSVQLMKRQSLPEPILRRLDAMEEECDRAARIIRDLLVFAQRRPPERRRVDVNDVIRDTLTLKESDLAQARVRVVADLASLPPIWADAHQLTQVLVNLFANARHAMKTHRGGGLLTVRSLERGGDVVIEVEDDGPGIPPESLGRIFDPFFTTKGTDEGSGLGLSLAIGIVEAHGGTIHVENVPASGARFTVRLPIGADTPSAPAEDAGPEARRARVLVVDDDVKLRATLMEVFASLGHDVEAVGSGAEALARLEKRVFDVIALDMRLPNVDGRGIWQDICALDATLASRVVFMTGDTMRPETRQFLETSGRPVLTKPFTIARVSQIVTEMMCDEHGTARDDGIDVDLANARLLNDEIAHATDEIRERRAIHGRGAARPREQSRTRALIEHGRDVVVGDGREPNRDVLDDFGEHAACSQRDDGPEHVVASRAEQQLHAARDALLHDHARGAGTRAQRVPPRAHASRVGDVEQHAARVGLVDQVGRIHLHHHGVADRLGRGNRFIDRGRAALATEAHTVGLEQAARGGVRQRAVGPAQRIAHIGVNLRAPGDARRGRRTRLPERAPRAHGTLGARQDGNRGGAERGRHLGRVDDERDGGLVGRAHRAGHRVRERPEIESDVHDDGARDLRLGHDRAHRGLDVRVLRLRGQIDGVADRSERRQQGAKHRARGLGQRRHPEADALRRVGRHDGRSARDREHRDARRERPASPDRRERFDRVEELLRLLRENGTRPQTCRAEDLVRAGE